MKGRNENMCVGGGVGWGCRVVMVAKSKLDCHFILCLISALFLIRMHMGIYNQSTDTILNCFLKSSLSF